MRFSEDLQRYIDELEEEYKRDETWHEEHNEHLDWIRSLMLSLEGFSDSRMKELHQGLREHIPSFLEHLSDEFYTREFLSHTPLMVKRFIKLTPVLAGRVPSKEINIYLREATRCFIYGFFHASTALSRAALEIGLNENLKRRIGWLGEDTTLVSKIRKAAEKNLINPKTSQLALKVVKAGNSVLHKKPASEKLAFDTLKSAREVLLELHKK